MKRDQLIKNLLTPNITTGQYKKNVYNLFGEKINLLCPDFLSDDHPFTDHAYINTVFNCCILLELEDAKRK